MVRMVDAELKMLGITSAQLSPLLIMARRGPTNQRDLVRESAIAQPAMASSLGILLDAGFISRQHDADDRRARVFDLTAKGRTIIAAATPILRECNTRATKRLSADERQMLVQLMQKVVETLSDTES